MSRTRRLVPVDPEAPDQPAGRVQMCVVCSQGQVLGRIEGTLNAVAQAQQDQTVKLETMDGRLRNVENRSAIAGAVAALMVTLGLDLIRAKLKG